MKTGRRRAHGRWLGTRKQNGKRQSRSSEQKERREMEEGKGQNRGRHLRSLVLRMHAMLA